MRNSAGYNQDAHNRQIVAEGTNILERTAESLARSHQVAVETEDFGTEVISNLSEQREALLRTKNRLTDMDRQLDHSNSILKRMGRNVVYNKMILVLIIISEVGILCTVCYLKFFKK